MTFPTTGILDNFNRTNANPLDGNWVNGFWGDNNMKLVSNALMGAVNGWNGAYYNTSYGADQECYITLTTKNATLSLILMVRSGGTLTSSPNGYAFYVSGTTGSIRRVTSGSGTTLGATFTVAPASGVKYGISVIGDTIAAYENTAGTWTELASRTDSTYTEAGYLAIEVNPNSDIWDDFGGGEYVAPVTGNPYYAFAQQ